MGKPDDKLSSCTGCSKSLKLLDKSSFDVHPLLKTLLCTHCRNQYGDGDYSKYEEGIDSEGDDNYCRWCADGGDLLVCCNDGCHYAYCEKCIKRNVGKKKYRHISESDDWECFACDPSQIQLYIDFAARQMSAKDVAPEKEEVGETDDQSTNSLKRLFTNDDEQKSKKQKTESIPEPMTSTPKPAPVAQLKKEARARKSTAKPALGLDRGIDTSKSETPKETPKIAKNKEETSKKVVSNGEEAPKVNGTENISYGGDSPIISRTQRGASRKRVSVLDDDDDDNADAATEKMDTDEELFDDNQREKNEEIEELQKEDSVVEEDKTREVVREKQEKKKEVIDVEKEKETSQSQVENTDEVTTEEEKEEEPEEVKSPEKTKNPKEKEKVKSLEKTKEKPLEKEKPKEKEKPLEKENPKEKEKEKIKSPEKVKEPPLEKEKSTEKVKEKKERKTRKSEVEEKRSKENLLSSEDEYHSVDEDEDVKDKKKKKCTEITMESSDESEKEVETPPMVNPVAEVSTKSGMTDQSTITTNLDLTHKKKCLEEQLSDFKSTVLEYVQALGDNIRLDEDETNLGIERKFTKSVESIYKLHFNWRDQAKQSSSSSNCN